jgi:hypothetical protein
MTMRQRCRQICPPVMPTEQARCHCLKGTGVAVWLCWRADPLDDVGHDVLSECGHCCSKLTLRDWAQRVSERRHFFLSRELQISEAVHTEPRAELGQTCRVRRDELKELEKMGRRSRQPYARATYHDHTRRLSLRRARPASHRR